jgi:hypothetical protein
MTEIQVAGKQTKVANSPLSENDLLKGSGKSHHPISFQLFLAIAKMTTVFKIQGNLRDRFVQSAVLLRMLDPVRGEPTVYGLDQDPHEIGTERERQLKRKFLDSFALISATKKDGKTVSAACLEEGALQGTVVRLARNSGVGEDDLKQLRDLVIILNHIAQKGLLFLHKRTREA